MIKYISRKHLDIDKYNKCINTSLQCRVYAHSWFLDTVSTNWDALVLNDYEMVMPLPKRIKLGIHYIYPPLLTQQLGIFSKNEISEDIFLKFIQAIPKKFKKISIPFNSENKFISPLLSKKKNYIIPLNKPYELIYKNYSKLRKRVLKQALALNLSIKENDSYEKIITLFKEDIDKRTNLTVNDYSIIKKLFETALEKKIAKIVGVYDSDNNYCGGVVFLISNERIYSLFLASNKEGKKNNAITFANNYIIEKYSNTNYIFDFEGSSIPSIEQFFLSFGAELEEYSFFQKKFSIF